MKVKVKDLYLEEVLNKYKELFKIDRVSYDDETGIYKLQRVNLKIKSWNNNIEPLNKTGFNSNETIANLFKFMNLTEKYWFEFEEDEEDENEEE